MKSKFSEEIAPPPGWKNVGDCLRGPANRYVLVAHRSLFHCGRDFRANQRIPNSISNLLRGYHAGEDVNHRKIRHGISTPNRFRGALGVQGTGNPSFLSTFD